MQQLIRNWLNSSHKEYFTGLALLRMCQPNAANMNILKRGPSDSNKKTLHELLTDQLASSPAIFQNQHTVPSQIKHQKIEVALPPVPGDHSDTTLYQSAKKEADLAYKALMNERAVLFAGVRSLMIHEDINAPVLQENRKKSCINLVLEWQRVSKLYDRADFVLKNGLLPTIGTSKEDADVSSIPDQLVKQNLDNARKNYSKMKRREATPERIQRMTEIEKLIKQLEARWQLLKLEK